MKVYNRLLKISLLGIVGVSAASNTYSYRGNLFGVPPAHPGTEEGKSTPWGHVYKYNDITIDCANHKWNIAGGPPLMISVDRGKGDGLRVPTDYPGSAYSEGTDIYLFNMKNDADPYAFATIKIKKLGSNSFDGEVVKFIGDFPQGKLPPAGKTVTFQLQQ